MIDFGNVNTVRYVIRECLNIGVLRKAYANTGEIGFLCYARVDVVAYYPQAISVIENVITRMSNALQPDPVQSLWR